MMNSLRYAALLGLVACNHAGAFRNFTGSILLVFHFKSTTIYDPIGSVQSGNVLLTINGVWERSASGEDDEHFYDSCGY